MKSKKIFGTTACLFAMIMLVIASCNKDIEFSENLTPLQPTSLDEDAENWAPVDAGVMTLDKITTIVETSTPKVFNPPADISSDAYKAELATIKDAQSHLTSEQRSAIEYWSGGGVLRW